MERAEAGGDTDLVLTQLWERPRSKRGSEPNGSCPGQRVCLAESPAPKTTKVRAWRGSASSHLHDRLGAAEDTVCGARLCIPAGHSPWDALWLR